MSVEDFVARDVLERLADHAEDCPNPQMCAACRAFKEVKDTLLAVDFWRY